jgi:hypothetical protein
MGAALLFKSTSAVQMHHELLAVLGQNIKNEEITG